jgi:two-component system chemotaxis sensor kinase CheA
MPIDELRRTFLAEAAEMLRIVDLLVVREADEPGDADIGAAIRRNLHTVKGTCGFLGLPRVEALAHVVENCLVPPDRSRGRAERAIIRAAIARMERIIGRIDTAGLEPPGADSDVLAALEEISGRASENTAANGDGAARLNWDGEPVPPAISTPRETYLALTDGVPDEQVRKTLSRLADIAGRLHAEASDAGMQPIGEVWPLLARAAGELASAAGKQVFFTTEGGDIAADREVAQHVFQPLLQLVRNAIAHGIEPCDARRRAGKSVAGRVTLSARQIGSRLIISIGDDGAGIDPALGESVFAPGVTTHPVATLLAGRGVGLDIVRSRVEEIDGLISMSSTPGVGTTFTIDVPISLAGDGLPMRRQTPAAAQPLAAAFTWR